MYEIVIPNSVKKVLTDPKEILIHHEDRMKKAIIEKDENFILVFEREHMRKLGFHDIESMWENFLIPLAAKLEKKKIGSYEDVITFLSKVAKFE